MKRFAIPIILFLAGCSGNETGASETPGNIIEKEDLIPLIVDIQVLQEHYHNVFVRPDVYRDALDSASTHVFEDHGVTKEDYDRSLNYYANQTDTIYSIFEAALDTVNFRMNATSQQ